MDDEREQDSICLCVDWKCLKTFAFEWKRRTTIKTDSSEQQRRQRRNMETTKSSAYAGYRDFLVYFAENVDPTDQLPVRVSSFALNESEITGAVTNWIIQYLNDKWVYSCSAPTSLTADELIQIFTRNRLRVCVSMWTMYVRVFVYGNIEWKKDTQTTHRQRLLRSFWNDFYLLFSLVYSFPH